jgi:hypothetical protein
MLDIELLIDTIYNNNNNVSNDISQVLWAVSSFLIGECDLTRFLKPPCKWAVVLALAILFFLVSEPGTSDSSGVGAVTTSSPVNKRRVFSG